MGRPKGSKNKPKEGTPLPVKPVVKPVEMYVPQTPITLGALTVLATKARNECIALMEVYGLDTMPDFMGQRFIDIQNAVDAEQARARYAKALDRMQIYLWALWANGKISGPTNKLNVEAKAKKAESLARYLESIGQVENARKQRDRAQRLRDSVIGEEDGQEGLEDSQPK